MTIQAPLASGITTDTPKNVMLGAGTIHKGLVFGYYVRDAAGTLTIVGNTATPTTGEIKIAGAIPTFQTFVAGDKVTLKQDWAFAESLIGATGDGNKLTIEPEYMDLEPDGAWVKVAGMQVKTGEKAELEISPIEITPELMKMALTAQNGDSDATGYGVLVSKEHLETGDYIEDFGWVGQTLDGRPMVIIFPLALCTSGLEIEGKNKDKATPKLTIECVQEAGANAHVLPYRIYTPTPAA